MAEQIQEKPVDVANVAKPAVAPATTEVAPAETSGKKMKWWVWVIIALVVIGIVATFLLI